MSSPVLLLLLLLACSSLAQRTLGEHRPGSDSDEMYDGVRGRCEPVREFVCKELPYNLTVFPNLVGTASQEEADKRMRGYKSLITSACSSFLRVFLCSVYFPMCNPKAKPAVPLKPCREFCLHIKSRCEPVMRLFSYQWPTDLTCSQFPGQSQLCLLPKNLDGDKTIKKKFTEAALRELKQKYPDYLNPEVHGFRTRSGKTRTGASGGEGKAHKTMVNVSCSPAEVKVMYEQNETCLTRCHANVLFTKSDKSLAEVWTTVWAVFCLLSSILTVVTYAADSARFRYPERPIVYLCICYLFYSLTFIIRAAVGASSISCRELDRSTERFLIRGGHEGTWCTITFLINYFFLMASCLWWVILTLAWFLSAAKKWGHEGVEAISSLFHMVAWAVPAVGTIVILIMHRIDGDELTGMCFVGSQDRDSLLIFVIAPMCVLLVVGITFLLFGFVSLMGVRKDLKMKEDAATANIRRLEKLMVRIGIFSVLYVVPFVCVIGSHFYEFFNMPIWQRSVRALTRRCIDRAGLHWSAEECKNVILPSVEVYMLKLFMSLVVGITSGTWVWGNKKSVASWSHCMQLLIFRRRAKLPAPIPPLGTQNPAALHTAYHGQQTTPLMMHSGSMFAKHSMSRSVTSKLSDRLTGGSAMAGAGANAGGRVSSSCV